MEVFEAINTRRSIRKYQQKEVPQELIKQLLSAAMQAPSTGNAQTWEFVVVTEQSIKDKIKDIHPYVKMITEAPLGILICGNLSKEKFEGYWPQDCAAAMENLLLAAHATGLGAVWTGVHPMKDREEKFKNIFNLPDNIIPFGFVVIGYPDQQSKPVDRYNEEVVHYNKW